MGRMGIADGKYGSPAQLLCWMGKCSAEIGPSAAARKSRSLRKAKYSECNKIAEQVANLALWILVVKRMLGKFGGKNLARSFSVNICVYTRHILPDEPEIAPRCLSTCLLLHAG